MFLRKNKANSIDSARDSLGLTILFMIFSSIATPINSFA